MNNFKMFENIFEKINDCKAFIASLSIKISGEAKVTSWFKELCAILTELLNALTDYIKRSKPKIERTIKDNVVLYMMQMTASLSLLIKIFLKEHDVLEVISEARHCILKQLSWCLDGLTELLTTEKCSDNSSGSFIKWMDASLDKLAEIDVEKDADDALVTCEGVRPTIEEVLCHAMSIAQVALEDDCKIIKGSSHTVLETLESLTKEINKSNANVAMVNLFVDCCCDKLCLLERKVNTAVLKLTLHIFSDYTKPLESLYEYCFSKLPKTEEELDAFIADFDMHVDRIMQIGLFAVACSTDADRCIKMRSCLASLEALEGELVPALTAVSIDPSVHNINFALLLKGYWIHQSQTLKELIYLIIDPSAFCQVTYDRLKQVVNDICDSMKTDKSYVLSEETVEGVTADANVLRDMLKVSLTDFSSENIEEVKDKFKDFSDVFYEVKSSAKKLLGSGNDVSRHDAQRVLKRSKILLSTIKSLIKAMVQVEDSKQNVMIESIRTPESNVTNINKTALSDLTNKVDNNTKVDSHTKGNKNALLEHIEDKGKQIVKDRSILYKTPTKLSVLQKFASDATLAKNNELPLSRLVHLRKLNFCAQKPNANTNETSIDLQITDILSDLTNLSCSMIQI